MIIQCKHCKEDDDSQIEETKYCESKTTGKMIWIEIFCNTCGKTSRIEFMKNESKLEN